MPNDTVSESGKVILIVDLNRGDMGKAKFMVDQLALPSSKGAIVVRPMGGAGSGRTAYIDGQKVVFSQLPEGIAYKGMSGVIGNSAWVYPDAYQFDHPTLAEKFNSKVGLVQELERLAAQKMVRSRLTISPKAALGMPWHAPQDLLEELVRLPNLVGTTLNGMGPIASDYWSRNGLRMGDLLLEREELQQRFESAYRLKVKALRGLLDGARSRVASLDAAGRERMENKLKLAGIPEDLTEVDFMGGSSERVLRWLFEVRDRLAHYVHDPGTLVREHLARGGTVGVIIPNGRYLNVYDGDYPMVTASDVSVHAGLKHSCLPSSAVTWPKARIVGGIKAYQSFVGEGHFVTELKDATGDKIRDDGHEYGTVSGRPRRVGWLDLVMARTGALEQDINELSVTRMDILTGHETLKVCVEYLYLGSRIRTLPSDARIEECRPMYKAVVGWTDDIAGVTSLSDLPLQAVRYLQLIEREMGVKITHVGTGPALGECIHCPDGVGGI